MRYLVPLALLVTLGCYSPRTIGEGTAYPADHDRWSSGLDARLWYDETTGHASFTVNQPAHVALFALRPGAAVEMIYPSLRYGGLHDRFSRGSHWIRTSGSPHRFAGNWSTVHGSGPIYILMIASKEPLEVSRFLHTSRMGWLHTASFIHSPYMAVNALAEDIVPAHRSTDWTSAIYVVWPEGAYHRDRGPAYVNIRCPSGVVLTVPTEAWRRGYVQCPNSTVPTPPQSDSTSPPDTGQATIRDGVPERPVPPGWMRPPKEGEEADNSTITSIVEGARQQRRRPFTGGVGSAGRGEVEITPAVPPRPVFRPGVPDRPGVQPDARRRPGVPRVSRPAARSGDAATSRPSTRPSAKPASRPTQNRPAARPRPNRPDPPSRPAPRPKPKPDNDPDSGES